MPTTPTPTIAELREWFHYNPETGDVYWLQSPAKSVPTGAKAGSLCNGYLRVRFNYKNYFLHRVAWALYYGVWPKELDHKDCNKLNNRINNLREATHSQNKSNTGLRTDNTSGHTGVSWCVREKRWKAKINANKKWRGLGAYTTLEEALEVRQLWEDMLLGEFRHGYHPTECH